MKTTKALYEKAAKICQKYVKAETAVKKCNGDLELITLVTLIYNRVEKRNSAIITVDKFCKGLIEKRLKLIAKALPDEGFSMGSFVKVHLVSGQKNLITVIDDRTQEYAASSKYRATHGEVSLKITKNELINIKVIGGLVTYIYLDQSSKVKKCWWHEGHGSKQYFKLEKVNGFIYAGFHEVTREAAKIGGEKNILREKEFKQNHIKYQKVLKRKYSFADSLAAGNCESGTRAFCLRLNLNSEKQYRGNYLLKIAKEKSTNSIRYIEQMINYKAKTLK